MIAMRVFGFILSFVLVFGVFSGDGFAKGEKRVALVIGNGAYATMRELINPINDAKAIAKKLRAADFKVVEVYDAKYRVLRRKLKQFQKQSQNADVKLLFYSGHGLEFDGVNYLVPIDADIEEPNDVQRFSLDLQRMINRMTASGGINIVILDACRDNPFKAQPATRSLRQIASRGFVPIVEDNGSDLAIMFSTAPGAVASDGVGNNSPFTKALVKNIDQRGLDLEALARRVVKDVGIETDNKQRPWTNVSLSRRFYFHSWETADSVERYDWKQAQKENSIAAYQKFLTAYPQGRFAVLAGEFAQKENTIDEYEAYLKVKTNKLHRAAAREAIIKIDNANWAKAKRANNVQELRVYLSYVGHKANRSAALEALRKLDDRDWQTAGKANTVSAYRNYILIWDDNNDDLDGAYLQIAHNRIGQLTEEDVWSSAQTAKAPAGYGDYLKRFPNGVHAAEARKKLTEMEDNVWKRAQQENTAHRYREYVRVPYFRKHKAQAKKLLRETEAEELWVKAELDQLDRSVTTVAKAKRQALQKLVREYQGTPAAGRAEKLLSHLAKSSPGVGTLQGSVGQPRIGQESASNACDRLAANPGDPGRVGAGIGWLPTRAIPGASAPGHPIDTWIQRLPFRHAKQRCVQTHLCRVSSISWHAPTKSPQLRDRPIRS